MLTPAAVVAFKLLRALRVDTVAEAKPIVAQWAARPRLSPGDIRDVLAELDRDDGEHYHREPEPETGGPLPPNVGGYSLGGRNRGESGEQS